MILHSSPVPVQIKWSNRRTAATSCQWRVASNLLVATASADSGPRTPDPGPRTLNSGLIKPRIYTIVGIAVFWLLNATTLPAQINTDSLISRLDQAGGSERIETLVSLVRAFERGSPVRAVAYGREALMLLKELPDANLELDVLYLKGRAHIWLGEYDSVFVQADRANALASATGLDRGIAEAANLKGIALSMQGDFVQAIAQFDAALAVWQEMGEVEGANNALNNMGIAHMRLGNYDEALDHYLRSLAGWEELGDRAGISRLLINTGNVQLDLGNSDEALKSYVRALGIKEELGDSMGVAMTLNNIGIINTNRGNGDEALAQFLRALAIWDDANDQNNLGRVLVNIADLHTSQHNYDEALSYARRGLKIKEDIGDRRGIALALNSIGVIHEKLNQYDLALDYLQRALTTADQVGELRLARDIYETLSNIYERRGDYRAALEASRLFKSAQDSLFNAESQNVVAELQTRYQTTEQQQQIELLQREREIQTLWRNLLIGGVACLVLISFLIYSRYRLKNRANHELEETLAQLKVVQAQLIQQEKMASLGQLTAGIAHEIRNPLNFVSNFANVSFERALELKNALYANPDLRVADVREELEDLMFNAGTIVKHSQRADSIVTNMMGHVQAGDGKRSITDLNSLVDEYADLAYEGKRAQAPNFDVSIERHFSDDAGSIEISPQEIGRILINLLGNAFDAVRYASKTRQDDYAPRVEVTTRRVGRHIEIEIADNGIGIPVDIQRKIFEPFFTTKSPGEGTGLGLSLAYEIITQGYGGTLTVESEENQGARFIIALPA